MTPTQLREIIADICKEEVEKQAHFLLDRFDNVLKLMMKQYPESQRGLAQAQAIMGNYRMVFGGELSPDVVQRIGAFKDHRKGDMVAPEEAIAPPPPPRTLSDETKAKMRETRRRARELRDLEKSPEIRINKIDRAVMDYKAGETDIKALAKKYNCSSIYLRSYLKRTGVMPVEKPGRKPSPATIERNESIVTMHRAGMKPKSIAQIYGVSAKLVSQVVFQATRNDSGAPPAPGDKGAGVVVPGNSSRPL